MPDSIDILHLLELARREGALRIISWMAMHGEGDVRGWLLEAAEEAVELGEVDGKADD